MRLPQTPPAMSGPRFNEFINVPKVRVIDENGENLGVMFTKEAIEQAAGVGLDLVEISPGADPPVAKFLDIGRFKYEAQKKANEQRKKQKTQEIKEIKMRPNIDDHDYQTKMKKVVEFLEDATRSSSPCSSVVAKWRMASSVWRCSSARPRRPPKSPRSRRIRAWKVARC